MLGIRTCTVRPGHGFHSQGRLPNARPSVSPHPIFMTRAPFRARRNIPNVMRCVGLEYAYGSSHTPLYKLTQWTDRQDLFHGHPTFPILPLPQVHASFEYEASSWLSY